MENATKALLIAAAVLIAIILIAMGIKLLSSTQGAMNQSGEVASDLEASIFNSKFEAYEGKAVRGSQVKQLARKVIQFNETNVKDNSIESGINRYYQNKLVYLDLSDDPDKQRAGSANVITNWISNIDISSTYTVKITKFRSNGYVEEIKIRKNS